MQADSLLHTDEAATEALRQEKPWLTNARYFQDVSVSASAAMKMMTHAISGVEKGMSGGGKPVEVMGLMMGHLCPENPTMLVVTDAFPLPVEGAETRVLADDQEVMNFMIDLGESLEQTRTERFMGWYHSHPFDVDVHSHCFMSATDITTQLGWQRAEDRNGNPWLAIVVDPLRSLAKGRPEIGAFRAYPPEYNPPKDELPDGTIETDDKIRVERWGSCWNRYHTMNIKFFMSSLGANILSLISKNYLWMSAISSTPYLEKENRDRFAERVNGLTDKIAEKKDSLKTSSLAPGASSFGASFSMFSSSGGDSASSQGLTMLEKSAQTSCDLSVEQLQGQMSQIAKYILFSSSNPKPPN